MKIYFCKHSNGVEQAAHKLEKSFPNLKTEIKSCIHQCSRCKKNLVAKLDGQEIQGCDEKSLVKEVERVLKKKKKLESKPADKKRPTHEKKLLKNKGSKDKDAKDKDPKDKKLKNKKAKSKKTKEK